MTKRDHYGALGVGKNASDDEIKKVYRRLAMKYHPGRNPDSKEVEGKFKEAKGACEMLSDAEKKTAYDQHGHAGVDPNMADGFGAGGAGSGGGFAEAFGDIFGDIFDQAQGQGGRRGGGPQTYRGADLRYSMKITLEQAAHGYDTQIRAPCWDECDHCHGKGAEPGSSVEICPTCHGAGQVRVSQGFFTMQQTCPKCHGSGKYIPKPCTKCHDQGRLKSQKTLEAKIPAGIDEGMCIRLSGSGEPGINGGPSGDLYVGIHIKPHPVFECNGDDLHRQMPIPSAMAATGGDIEAPTLGGHASFTIPEGTQIGKTFRLCGKGVKGVRSGYAGDLYVHINIETPARLTEHQRELFRQFDKSVHKGGSRYSPQEQSRMDKVRNPSFS